ncbi:hypothetical protein DPMN_048612 [Dreissena polymorpha]|uniref:Uncharacterized protein n=1 Tax=Dreissena polymorpha TaxID=45954 RepID=A0A9D4DBX3_DREPO|nr:hypothetical protein DPMN_048612 [Dreissena polymorpha]
MMASTATSRFRAKEHSLSQRFVPGDVSEPSQLSSFDGHQEGLLWANKWCTQLWWS